MSTISFWTAALAGCFCNSCIRSRSSVACMAFMGLANSPTVTSTPPPVTYAADTFGRNWPPIWTCTVVPCRPPAGST